MAEPFLTVLKISMFGGFLLALPIILWQVWSFFAPAIDEGQNRRIRIFVAFASLLLVGGIFFGYFVTLPAAIHYLTNYDKDQFNIQSEGEGLLLVRDDGALRDGDRLRAADLRAGARAPRDPQHAQLRRNRRIGYFIVVVVAVALPGIDPFTTVLEDAAAPGSLRGLDLALCPDGTPRVRAPGGATLIGPWHAQR